MPKRREPLTEGEQRELRLLEADLEALREKSRAFAEWSLPLIRRINLQLAAGLRQEAVESADRLVRGADAQLLWLHVRQQEQDARLLTPPGRED